jgi:hypothetical protein
MGINISYDHIVMHKFDCCLGKNPQVNELEVMELDRMLSHSSRK